MIVVSLILNEGNGTSPAFQSSYRTGSRPSLSRYHATVRSTSPEFNTMWSMALTVNARSVIRSASSGKALDANGTVCQ